MKIDDGSDELIGAIGVTAEACGTPLSDAVLAIMVADLRRYPETSVMSALAKCRLGLKGRLTLADIIERIDDGRPGAEAAWAAVSDSTEAKTMVLTEEMQEALTAASPLMSVGDPVAARMAFVETYRRLILTSRADGRAIKWRVSLGQDPAGRLPALREAVEKGRITTADARALLPAHEAQTLTMPEAEARRVLEAGKARAGQTVQKLLADPRAVAIPAQSSGLTQAERAELEAFDSRPRGTPWSKRDAARHQELLGKLRADRVVDRGAMQGLAADLQPKRPPSKSIDWAAEERRLQEQSERDAG